MAAAAAEVEMGCGVARERYRWVRCGLERGMGELCQVKRTAEIEL